MSGEAVRGGSNLIRKPRKKGFQSPMSGEAVRGAVQEAFEDIIPKFQSPMSGEAVRGARPVLMRPFAARVFQSPMSGEAVRGISSKNTRCKLDVFQSPMSGEAVRGVPGLDQDGPLGVVSVPYERGGRARVCPYLNRLVPRCFSPL